MKYLLFMLLLLCISAMDSLSQSLKLIDQQSQQAIVNASYQYGKQQGITDRNGHISINTNEKNALNISHLNYGFWHISASELKTFLDTGIIPWQKQNFQLQTVSIIALHQNSIDSLSLTFNNQNRVSHDASAILAQLPEVALIRKSGNYGFDPVLRGFKYDQLNIVMDGAQSANAACPNRMDPPTSQMPLNMLSQIAVLKGPYSLRYGNAFGGTINFQTPPPAFSSKPKVDGRMSGVYESNGSIYRSEAMLDLAGQSANLKLFGSISTGDHYKDGDDNEVLSSFYRNNFGSSLALKLTDYQDIRLQISHNYAKDVDFPALSMDLRKDDTWLGSLHHSIRFRSKLKEWNTSIYGTYVDHLMDNYDKKLNLRKVDAKTQAKTNNYGGRSELHWQFKNSQLYAGIDYKNEYAEGERSRHFLMGPNAGNTIYDNVWQDASIDRTSVFGEYQHRYNQWQLVYSARLEYNQADAEKPDALFASYYDDLSSEQINRSLSLGISRRLSSHWSSELWLGHAERSASLSERFINFLPVGVDPYEMLGNPKLSSEKNRQVDLNLKYKTASTLIQLSGFVASMKDFISSEIRDDIDPKMPSSPGVRQFTNIDQARLSGFEITWSQQLLKPLQHNLSLAYTYGKNEDSGEALPEIPPLDMRYTLMGTFFKNRLKPEFRLRHVLEQKRIAKSYGETQTPAFTLVDLSVNYQISKHIEFNASIHNLFDETYYEHLNRSVKGSQKPIYAPGRSTVLTLVAKL
ncbi:MAG: TonB-dependent receptor [Carboxylicivirga sp.]|jgi:iron complex outermembrane receptor protein|nr:TonB-dependent receptor [Carboxylicivirga sp.]